MVRIEEKPSDYTASFPQAKEPSNNLVKRIAQAFGVENVYLLRYVSDEEFAEKCEEMLTDEKTTVADILTWCDYMESIEDTRPQLYRSANVSIKDVRDRMGSQERPVGDVIITTTAAALIAGSTPFTVTSIGKIGSEQVVHLVSEDSECDNLVCDKDAMGTMDDDDSGTIMGHVDNIEPKVLKVVHPENRDCINFDSVLLFLPDKPTFAVAADPIVHTISQNEWYCIATTAMSEGVKQNEFFINSSKLFMSDSYFYPVKRRKRLKAVFPFLSFDPVLTYVM
ncbi:hypothetical protein FOZ60_004147 [Perkinsus olseni]|uniref:Uncharacterized protein n=1 Tax=Perkinsus olseni TaxID=32597 RepID=A0A7J6NTX5_PEROL|nr:hypothetical protein FOZ60_004147 [Perkinsus olseni]